ncbi:MAG TPA: hypothetical protein VGI23_19215 [Steroidobacteraceae bacterium]
MTARPLDWFAALRSRVGVGITPDALVYITGGASIALSTLVTITDLDHVGFQQLELWDSTGTAA